MDKNSLAHTTWECKYHIGLPLINEHAGYIIPLNEILNEKYI